MQVLKYAFSLYTHDFFSKFMLKFAKPPTPGSLKNGFSFRTNAWIESNTCSIVDLDGSHISGIFPRHVFSRLKHTVPLLYRLGFSLYPKEW